MTNIPSHLCLEENFFKNSDSLCMGNILVPNNNEKGEINRPNNSGHVDTNKGQMSVRDILIEVQG